MEIRPFREDLSPAGWLPVDPAWLRSTTAYLARRFSWIRPAGRRISKMPRTAYGPRPQHVGPLRRTAKTRSFCAGPSAANRDGSRSVGGSRKMRPPAAPGATLRLQPSPARCII